jgi:hypothetical protein
VHWPELIIGGLIGAFVSAVISYVFFMLQARRDAASLAFQSSSVDVVTPSEEEVGGLELEVLFKGARIPRLTRTRMALWNAGWATVEGADISENDPLRIRLRDGPMRVEILDVRLVRATREAIAFSAEVRKGTCFVNFDFLDRHDGVVLDLLHTGSATGRPSIDGVIKGLPAGVSYYGDLIRPSQAASEVRRRENDPITVGQLAFVLLVAAGVLVGVAIGHTHSHGPNTLWWLYGSAAICAVLGTLLGGLSRSRRLPKLLADQPRRGLARLIRGTLLGLVVPGVWRRRS